MSGKKSFKPRPTVAELIGAPPTPARLTCEHQNVSLDGVVSPVCKALSVTRQHGWLCSHHSNFVHVKTAAPTQKIIRLDLLVITPDEIAKADARESRASDVDLRLLRVKGIHTVPADADESASAEE